MSLSKGQSASGSSRTLRHGLMFFVMTCLVATCGYVAAGWDWIDAIYMVTITIFGVGYGEVHPIEPLWLKLFTIGVIFAGCSSLIYVIGGIVQMLTEGEIEKMMGMRSRSREIESLHDHTIICGYGRIGQMLAAELQQQGESLVVLDRCKERVATAIEDGFLAFIGDCVDDDTLQQAGIFRARVLATVLPDDAMNVFITLTARGMSQTIRIIARAESPFTESKLIRSGATHVVMPAAIGAVRVAQLATCESHDQVALPKDRYRMLQTTDRSERPSMETKVDESIPTDVAELAEIASDLTRTVVNRSVDQIIEHEKAVE